MDRAKLAINFFERVLRHTSDEWYGKPFRLTPWQREATTAIFQTDENGRRLIRQVYIEIPKKTGKTEWAAGLALMSLVLDPNPGAQVYIAAAGLRQTQNVFRACCKMIEQSPHLRNMLRVLRSTNRILKRSDPDSFIAAVAADGDLTDGVNPSCVIADELHRWRTRKQMENWDVLSLGGIARRETLVVALTTAGTRDDSPLAWRYHEKTEKQAAGVINDPHFYGRIYAAPQGANWESEETWIQANPSLKQRGGFLDLEKIREAYIAATTNPEEARAFRRYYLNIWDQRDDRVIDMAQWDACLGDFRCAGWPDAQALIENFRHLPCWVGVDLSMTTDLSAVAAVFLEGDKYYVVPFFWLPDEGIRKRELRDGMPYSSWAREGYLETCPGNAIDPRGIKERILWIRNNCDLREVCLDPYNTREMSVQLVEEGVPCIEIRQTFTGTSEATKKLLHLVATQKLAHGGHPILRWNASCLTLKTDGNDLVRPAKPDRERDSSRIDGISATINAIARAMIVEGDQGANIRIV